MDFDEIKTILEEEGFTFKEPEEKEGVQVELPAGKGLFRITCPEGEYGFFMYFSFGEFFENEEELESFLEVFETLK